MSKLTILVLSLVSLLGCASKVVPAHEFDAVLEYDGQTRHAVIAFPERDPEAMHDDGDSSCGWTTGNCGRDRATVGTVRGDAPIREAFFTTLDDGENGTYDLALTPNAADVALAKSCGYACPTPPSCRIYDSEIGTRSPCYGVTGAFITLTRR